MSPSTRSTTATAALPGPLPTWHWPVRKAAPQRFYSMSSEIQQRRKGYFDILKKTQKGGLDVTEWLVWFLDCLDGAISRPETGLQHALEKAHAKR